MIWLYIIAARTLQLKLMLTERGNEQARTPQMHRQFQVTANLQEAFTQPEQNNAFLVELFRRD